MHRRLFQRLDDPVMVAAAERAWLKDAVILALVPAETAAETQVKRDYLARHLGTWRPQTAAAQAQCVAVTLMNASVAAEVARWGSALTISPGMH